jgi:hypothetical protein
MHGLKRGSLHEQLQIEIDYLQDFWISIIHFNHLKMWNQVQMKFFVLLH